MDTRITIDIKKNKLTLAGILDFESVLAVDVLGQEWLGSLTVQDCYVDLQSITYSNSAGIILLLSWLRCAHKNNRILKILSIPKNIMDLAKISGLDGLFNSVERK